MHERGTVSRGRGRGRGGGRGAAWQVARGERGGAVAERGAGAARGAGLDRARDVTHVCRSAVRHQASLAAAGAALPGRARARGGRRGLRQAQRVHGLAQPEGAQRDRFLTNSPLPQNGAFAMPLVLPPSHEPRAIHDARAASHICGWYTDYCFTVFTAFTACRIWACARPPPQGREPSLTANCRLQVPRLQVPRRRPRPGFEFSYPSFRDDTAPSGSCEWYIYVHAYFRCPLL